MPYLKVHDRQRVGSGQTQQTQDLEHLHCGDQSAAPLLQNVGTWHDVALFCGEWGCHGCIPRLHHLHLQQRMAG